MVDQVCPYCGQVHRQKARFCPATGKLLSSAPPIVISGPLPGAPVAASPMPPEGAAGLTGKLPQNALLHNRFVILRKIGQGGMAAVYLTVDTWQPGANWAVKEMSDAALAAHERGYAVTSFLQEANLLRALNHPNLPKVIDAFAEGGKQYLVMEFVPGRTLYEILNERGQPFTEKEVISWALQLCNVLDYLHTQNPKIIFRDMKPSNIMLTPQGQIKLIDFGIARFFKPGKSTDTMALGTPGYAAPEAISGQTDERSDLYSLCVTLHHLLTLHDPLKKLFNLPPVRQLNPTVSIDLERILVRGMQNQRDLRWVSAYEMGQELVRLERMGPSTLGQAPTAPNVVLPGNVPSQAAWASDAQTYAARSSGVYSGGTMRAPEPPSPGRQGAPGVYSGGGPVPIAPGQMRYTPAPPAQPMVGGVPPAGMTSARPTTRLLTFAAKATAGMSTGQMVMLGAAALILIVVVTWLLAPILDAVPINWNKVPIIAIFGALGYSAYPRRGVAFLSHTVLSSALVIAIWAKLGSQGYDWTWLAIGALVSGAFMELWVAFLPKIKGRLADEAWQREVVWIALMAVLGTDIFFGLVSQGAIVLDPVRFLLSATLGVVGWFLGDLLKQAMVYRRLGLKR
jgi:serine/threonine protein kinase